MAGPVGRQSLLLPRLMRPLVVVVLAVLLPLSAALGAANDAYAYVTYFYGDDTTAASLLATRVLVSSLKQSGTSHPVAVLVPPSLPRVVREVLEFEGAVVRPVAGMVTPKSTDTDVERALVHFRNKLLLWTLTEYTRVVLLDSDDLGTHSGLLTLGTSFSS